MGCRHGYTINGITSAFFGSGSDVLGSDGAEISPKMEMVFLCGSRDSSFLQNNVYHHCQTT